MDFDKQVLQEKLFYNYFNDISYGKYHYLIGHSITNFRNIDQWINEILPYLEELQRGKAKINDWNSFSWGGVICFRKDYVMILDKSIFQENKSFPGLINDKKENILNDEGEWILDINFIEKNYNEYVKISIDSFIYYCKQWVKILMSQTMS